jgi:hypothetical protein
MVLEVNNGKIGQVQSFEKNKISFVSHMNEKPTNFSAFCGVQKLSKDLHFNFSRNFVQFGKKFNIVKKLQ